MVAFFSLVVSLTGHGQSLLSLSNGILGAALQNNCNDTWRRAGGRGEKACRTRSLFA